MTADTERMKPGSGFMWARLTSFGKPWGWNRATVTREEFISAAVVPFKLTPEGFYPTREVCGESQIQEKALVVGKHYGQPTYSWACVDGDSSDNSVQWRTHYYDILPEGLKGTRVIRLRYNHSITDVSIPEARDAMNREDARSDPPEGLNLFRKFCGTSRPIGAPPQSRADGRK